MELKDQRIELLRPNEGSFRPDSRLKVVRLLTTALRQPVGVLLVALGVVSLAGCAAEVRVTTEETAPRTAAETAPPATEQRMTTNVAVRLLDKPTPSPVEQQAAAKPAAATPPPEPKKPVGIVGNGNSVTVVEGDLHVHIHEPSRLEHVEIEIRRYSVERDAECERLHREYEQKVRQLKRLFNQ